MTTRILLVGCGRLGLRVGELLLADQDERGRHEVLGLRRDPSSLPTGFVPVAADLSAALPTPLPRVDAMVITLTPSAAPSYREPLAHLAAALPEIPRRTVFVSSTRVLEGYDATRPLTEADPARPRSNRARVLIEGEETARELFSAVILRPAGIYGPGRDRLIRTVLAGRPVEHGRRTNRIHEADLARAILALLSSPAPPALLHATDGAPALLGEVVTHLAQQLGVPAPPRTSPDPGAGTVLDATALHELLGELEFPDFRAGYDAML
ncbi:SDR family NAD(P)-dependent oxidoreductase [Brachybacterium sp. J144]|uniref:SDR family NAD(P)-dependent oxidoreductase n=1 Tax=Brachybacterium sp. J144 TaxID=3116487 RepID=UPI002E764217|nr:SDR family NAD(P)-dependent oxidoreductase [Brachybacterium sp. J144]MEE1650669.1 SDR family NAD(P)-dependent oxidoreductase [Brachybacterium sp. J144]